MEHLAYRINRRLAAAIAFAAVVAMATTGAATASASTGATQVPPLSRSTAWSPTAIDARIQWQVEMILSQQRASGAILHGSGGVNVYFGNSAALGLVAEGSSRSLAAAERWHDWVMERLNRAPDAQGASFTSYDYAIRSGEEVATQGYDSVDSYAATTLSVAAALWRSGDPHVRADVASRAADYRGIAALLVSPVPTGVRKTSGLTQATVRYTIGYTMDNAEVYEGLADGAALFTGLGLETDAARLRAAAGASRAAILGTLWNPAAQTWNVYDRSAANLGGAFYPAGMAQYFPLIHGVVDAHDPRVIASWAHLTARWPGWTRSLLNRGEAATPMAYAAVALGHADGARAMLDDIVARYAPAWRYPTGCDATQCQWWTPSQAGWTIRTLLLLRRQTEPVVQ
ncbi:hypothetical protein IT072_19250 [Leifsonia sp. ZF2019]|uniref:hypothetical protein n=1 Tax=Leifsonia sp. ZF2019 TaxID=2781978 RepID=UPI001CBCABA0|nr:hypothetical protein [Leifsonia sp. ZF2019]UAJ79304.1 hypothetical protein IT072_19250 [Leifsonia sp. ZF2019]